MSGFYSNQTFCRIFSCYSPHSQNLSFKNEFFLHKSTAKGHVMVQGNVHKCTKYTRDWKQFQNKFSTFCTLISLSQHDSAPKMPWFINSSHTDLKLKICLSLLNLRKQQTVAIGELNWILEEHRVFGLQVIFSSKILDNTGYQRTKETIVLLHKPVRKPYES